MSIEGVDTTSSIDAPSTNTPSNEATAHSTPQRPSVDEIVKLIVEQTTFGTSESQRAVLVQLLDSGYTPEWISQKFGVRLSSVLRMMARRDVRAAMERGREARVCGLRSRVAQAAQSALDIFERAVEDEDLPVDVRLGAARDLLSWAMGKPGSQVGGDSVNAAPRVSVFSEDSGSDFRRRLAVVVGDSRGDHAGSYVDGDDDVGHDGDDAGRGRGRSGHSMPTGRRYERGTRLDVADAEDRVDAEDTEGAEDAEDAEGAEDADGEFGVNDDDADADEDVEE